MARLRPLRVLTDTLVVFVIAVLVIAFSVGSYRWVFKVNRAKPQAINPVMYPYFTLVNTSRLCCTREPYYHLWRTYDWRADTYAGDRVAGEFLRVPVVYVHGNGGSYFCARSLARFLYEANVRQRRLSLTHFDANVKRAIRAAMAENASAEPLEVGSHVPQWLRDSAEETVVRERTPLLATEMFSIDFLEESSTHSAVVMLKEARFLNHSMHLLMRNFLSTYRRVLELPAEPLRRSDESADSPDGVSPYPIANVEGEYVASCCQYASAPKDPALCALAQAHLRRFSTRARLQREVRQVQERGFWVWSESLGGAVTIVAALMQPSLYAGIVLIGSPTHYPPLFFDAGSTWLYRAISDAALRHYPQTQELLAYDLDWDTDVLPHDTPLRLIENMRDLPSESLAARIANTTLVSINGGALDDIVPSITGYLHRSAPRPPAFYTAATAAKLVKRDVRYGAFRRDVSTETMRGVGIPMDHRGLVYGLQFLNHSADSLVQAALLPDAAAHLAPERDLPPSGRDRLFPDVVETLSTARYEAQVADFLFALTLESVTVRRGEDGSVHKLSPADAHAQWGGDGVSETYERVMTEAEAVAHHTDEVCVDNGGVAIDIESLPFEDSDEGEEACGALRYADGPLHLLLGLTTYTPDEVLLSRLELYEDVARTRRVDAAAGGAGDVSARPATKLHLPSMRKDARKVIYGRVLNTMISFEVTRARRQDADPRASALRLAYARFCFHVRKQPTEAGVARDRGRHGGGQHSFLQYDVVDATEIQRKATPRYLGPHFVGNRVQVDMHAGYALIAGLDSSTQETRMQVDIAPGSAVFPFVMAGSLRSLYITVRGNSRLAADDPEHQMQFFFGPFAQSQTRFDYSWKAFSTFGGDLNETHVVYVLGDRRAGRPRLALQDLTDTARATATSLPSAAAWRWFVDQWPERWLAFFSAYSGIGKLGGAYVLLFFTFLVLAGEVEKWALYDPALRERFLRVRGRRLFYTAPLLSVVGLTAGSEMLFGTIASRVLRVCTDASPPPGLSNAEMTARMGWAEKAALIFLYGMTPDYRECQYSWVRMQSIPVWNSFPEHLATIYLGFALSTVILFMLSVFIAVCYAVGAALHTVLRTRCLFAWPRLAKLLLFSVWSIPMLSWIVLPNLPLCYRHFLGVALLNSSLFLTPRVTGSSLSLPVYLYALSVASTFPAHFEGAALTIRNHVMLRRFPGAFWDYERNTNITWFQAVVWVTVQTSLAAAYTTIYYGGMHERTYQLAQLAKRDAQSAERGDATAEGSSNCAAKRKLQEESDRYAYLLGDFGRRWPRLRRLARITATTAALASAWICLMVLRRPLEGSVILVGNMTLIVFLVARLIAIW